MRGWFGNHSLHLLFLLCLLTSHSVHTVAVRRHYGDAKKILTSPQFLNPTELIPRFRRRSFVPSDFVKRERKYDETASRKLRVQNERPVVTDRQAAGDGDFVIFASSPGRNGHFFSNVEKPTQGRQHLSSKKRESSGAETGEELSSKSSTSSSDDGKTSESDDTTNFVLEMTPTNSTSAQPQKPVPEPGAFLNVTTEARKPAEIISIADEAGSEEEAPEITADVELSFVNPSEEGFLPAGLDDSISSIAGDDNDSESDGDSFFPEQSVPPEPLEEPVAVLTPPDTGFGEATPALADLEDQDAIGSTNPPIIMSFESTVTEEEKSEPMTVDTEKDSIEPLAEPQRKPVSEVNDEAEIVYPSVAPNVLVDVPLSISSSDSFNTPEFDNKAREFLGVSTNTGADNWKPTDMSTTTRIMQRQEGSRWEITYQGELPQPKAQEELDKLERGINEGAMDSYLTERLSIPVTVRTASTPILDSTPQDEISIAASTPKDTSASNATTNEDGNNNLGVIFGTCFGLLGALVFAAAAFVFVRRRREDHEDHMLDGMVNAPTTIMSFETDRSESRYQTGAPTNPRGPQILRNQSRILDWQMDHATATGEASHILGRRGSDKMSKAGSSSDDEAVSTAEIIV